MKVNCAQIWRDMHVRELFDNFDDEFKKFLISSRSFYRSIKKVEELNQQNKIANNATIKATMHTLTNKWKEICDVFDIIEKDGINSIIDYIHGKFKIISSIIRQITTKDKDNVHKAKLDLCSSNLKGLLNNISNSITLLLNQREMLNEKEYLINSAITDVKSFINIYTDAHYHQFSMTSFMPCQLTQFKANVLSACNDIINAIKAAFSFDKEIAEIIDIIESMTDEFNEIFLLAEMPPTFIKTSRSTLKSRSLNRFNSYCTKKDPISEVKEFTKGFEETGSSAIVKLEMFITDITTQFKLQDDTSKDIWERLNDIKQQVSAIIKHSKDLEKEREMFVEKLRNQSRTVTFLMKENNKKEEEFEVAKEKILERTTDLEERNEELTKQINDALTVAQRRETQLFQIREKNEDNIMKNCLLKMIDRMNSVVDQQEVDFSFADDDIVSKAEKLSSSLVSKKCSKCRDREMRDIVNLEKLCKALNCNVDYIDDGITMITSRYIKAQRQLASLRKEMEEKDVEIRNFKVITNEIKMRTKDKKGIGEEENVAKAAFMAFSEIDIANREREEKIERKMREEYKSDFKEISDALNLSEKERENKYDILKAALNTINNANDVKAKLDSDEKYLHDIKSFLENQTSARKADYNNLGEYIMFLIKAIENAPNPLSNAYGHSLKEKEALRSCLEIGILKIAGILGKKEIGQINSFGNEKLISLFNKFVDDVRDFYDSNKDKAETQDLIIEKAHNDIAQLVRYMYSKNDIEMKDISSLSLQETIDVLCRIIERTS